MIFAHDTGIYISNGKGASITLVGRVANMVGQAH